MIVGIYWILTVYNSLVRVIPQNRVSKHVVVRRCRSGKGCSGEVGGVLERNKGSRRRFGKPLIDVVFILIVHVAIKRIQFLFVEEVFEGVCWWG